MLDEALIRARKLVEGLERQKQELETSPPALAPEQLADGYVAFEQALASARRMLTALEEAIAIAPNDVDDLNADR